MKRKFFIFYFSFLYISLSFFSIASDTFEDGDTITACLTAAEDTCGGTIDSTICRTFFCGLITACDMEYFACARYNDRRYIGQCRILSL
ncbi:hypothetical protein J7M00_05820 [bacterium]|nr:hypothetical protein [bacterium]